MMTSAIGTPELSFKVTKESNNEEDETFADDSEVSKNSSQINKSNSSGAQKCVEPTSTLNGKSAEEDAIPGTIAGCYRFRDGWRHHLWYCLESCS